LKPSALLDALSETVVGQHAVLESLLHAVIAGGHVALEGPPGLAKTLACRALAVAVAGSFKRVQFTPDLLPSDIVGTRVFDQRSGDFTTVLGPIFANVLLADEINRAPAKVQSALLEGMQERQVTIGPQSFPLPDPFLVTATMNPLDSDCTYALPIAAVQFHPEASPGPFDARYLFAEWLDSLAR
jgi:MoxR-like ATPase